MPNRDIRILVVEDEPAIAEAITDGLQVEGYEISVATDGKTGLRRALAEEPDLVILDLMLPGMDGLSVCRALRAESRVPVLMLTARDGESDEILGFELGADDYVTKPFSVAILRSRVRSLLRRAEPADAPEEAVVHTAGDLEVDVTRHEARRKGELLELTSTEFSLLAHLIAAPGRAFSREQLLEQVWGYHFEGYKRTVDTHVTRLRKKIEDDPSSPRYVLTVYKVGYKFAEDP